MASFRAIARTNQPCSTPTDILTHNMHYHDELLGDRNATLGVQPREHVPRSIQQILHAGDLPSVVINSISSATTPYEAQEQIGALLGQAEQLCAAKREAWLAPSCSKIIQVATQETIPMTQDERQEVNRRAKAIGDYVGEHFVHGGEHTDVTLYTQLIKEITESLMRAYGSASAFLTIVPASPSSHGNISGAPPQALQYTKQLLADLVNGSLACAQSLPDYFRQVASAEMQRLCGIFSVDTKGPDNISVVYAKHDPKTQSTAIYLFAFDTMSPSE